MTTYKSLAFSPINGGGNFERSELAKDSHVSAQGLWATIKGRVASFLLAMLLVLFVFSGALSLTSCSSNDDDEQTVPQVDYQALLTAHEWEITTAKQSLGAFWTDALLADAYYCQLSADSIIFSEANVVNNFDYEGNVKSEYEITPCGKYPYAVKGDEIKIGNQTFIIKHNQSTTDSSFILQNEEWMLVLKKK